MHGGENGDEEVVDAGVEGDNEVKEYTQMSGVSNMQDPTSASMSRSVQQVKKITVVGLCGFNFRQHQGIC